MSDWYILQGKIPVKCDLMTAAMAMNEVRRVGRTTIGEFEVSTVFLGLDHGRGFGRPLLFESMVFKHGREFGNYMRRYPNWDMAQHGHKNIVEKLRSSIDSQKVDVDVK